MLDFQSGAVLHPAVSDNTFLRRKTSIEVKLDFRGGMGRSEDLVQVA